MAKPKIFISSTCYDLHIVREELTRFLEERGFEVLNSEEPAFGITPGLHSTEACLEQVESAEYFLLIIGKAHGSNMPTRDRSVVHAEYQRAMDLGLVFNCFVHRDVWAGFLQYRKTPDTNLSTFADDPRVFTFVDAIASRTSDNSINQFSDLSDIETRLTHQFAHYLSLYARFLGRVGTRRFTLQTMSLFVNGTLGVCEVLATEVRPIEAKSKPAAAPATPDPKQEFK